MKEKLNNNINQYNSDVNADEIWAAIEPRVDELNAKKKKKRRGLFFFLGGLALVAVFSTTFYVLNDGTNQTKNEISTQKNIEKEQEVNRNEIAANKTKKIKEQETRRNELIASKSEVVSSSENNNVEKSQKEVNPKAAEDNSQEKNSSVAKSNTQTMSDAAKNKKTRADGRNPTSFTTNNEIKNKAAGKALNENQVSQGRFNTATVKASDSNQQRAEEEINASEIKATTGTRLNSEGVIDAEQTIVEELSKNKTAESNSKQQGSSVDNLINNKNSLETNHADEAATLNKQVLAIDLISIKQLTAGSPAIEYSPLVVPTRKRRNVIEEKPFTLSLGVSGGAYTFNRNMTAPGSSSNAYRQLRLETETPLEAIEYGVDFNIEHKSGLSLSLGYHRVDINERFDSRNVVVDSFSENDVTHLVINLMNDTVKIYGPVLVTDVTTTTYEVYNRYRLVEVPIILGYQHQLNKWKVGAHVGVLANLSLSTNGRIFNNDGGVVLLTDENTMYNDRIALGYQFGFSVERPIIGRLSLRLAPTVKIYPNMINDGQQLSSKYTLLGGQIGLNYRLN